MFLEIIIFVIICNSQDVLSSKTRNVKIIERRQSNAFTSCFEHLGCLSTTAEWFHNVHRPRNLEPLDRHTIRTEFILITRDADISIPLNFDTLSLKPEGLSISGYRRDKQLIIMVHDFTSNGYTGWIKHIAVAYLSKMIVNLVSVDWEAGAEPPFEQAIANARVVALELTAFINVLKANYSLKPECIHLIGHGVGAHIAGYVGNSTRVERITGLDPTGPFFEEMPPIVRLDPGDARYVEVLHTDAFNSRSQGAVRPLGHADFYVNGARLQPACNQSTKYPPFTKIDRNTLKEGAILPACSHKRSFKYFIEALETRNCEFTGIRCACYNEFLEGKCTSCGETNVANCTTFGLVNTTVPTTHNKYYVNTRGEPPYCMNSYRVTINLAHNEHAKKHQQGYFDLIMVDEGGIVVNASSGGVDGPSFHTFEAGKSYTLVYYASPPAVKHIIEMRLRWIHKPNALCVVFCNTAVYVHQVTIRLLSASKTRHHVENRLCPRSSKTEIQNGSFVVFVRCCESKVPPLKANTTAAGKGRREI